MRVAEMFATRKRVAALDLVQKAVLEEELQRAIDGRRRDRLSLAFRERLDDRVGPERSGALAEDGQDVQPQRRHLQALARAGGAHLFRPVRRAGFTLGRGHYLFLCELRYCKERSDEANLGNYAAPGSLRVRRSNVPYHKSASPGVAIWIVIT